jgi:general secretion pathway protein D
MLYSPEFHKSKECGRLATVTPERSSVPAAVPCGRLGASSLSSWHSASSSAAIQRRQNFGATQNIGAKEADSIGMTRGYLHLLTRLSFRFHRGFAAALLVLLAAFAYTPSAHAVTAGGWEKRGEAAELRQDYDAAYEDYLHAHQKKPGDMRYQERLDRMRFQAAAMHVDRGRVLRQSGDIAGALNQFTRALQIDPGNEAAAQEVQITQHQDQTPGASTAPIGTTENGANLKEISDISPPLELKPFTDEMIPQLHMVEDAKVIYQTLGKMAGLNVIFDPDFVSKRIPVDLANVSLSDALRIVGTVSGTFYKAVTADTIFVAQNNHTKHTDLDDLAVQTFYLTNASQQSDGNEIVQTLRNVLPADDKIYLVQSQNAVVMRAPPEHLVLAEKLLNDLDRTKAEVVVDVAILEVSKDKMRNLGISLPQSFGISPQANNSTTSTASGTTGGTTSNSAFTLNTLANMNATNFAVTIGGGTLNALLSDTDTKVLQNPSIRATDGQTATMKIGSKIPVATGSYSAGAATGITAGIGVQTQFTYIDVGVNIDMTPTIHLDREVTLKLSVEVSTESGNVTISGVTEPIIGQRSDKTVIQLKDGEPCLLAGILTKLDNYSNSGTPGLSQIPLIKYLFGSINKEVQDDEVVFILIPHIVRESVLTRLNTRSIDTGTGTDIELRHSPIDNLFPESAGQAGAAPASNTTAANAATAMVQQMRQQAMPPGAAANPPAAKPPAAASGPPVTFTMAPVNSTQTVGSTFLASVILSNAHDVFTVPLEIQFDPKVLQLVNVDTGGLLGGDGQSVALVHRDDGNGHVTVSASRPPGVNGVNGDGQVCILTFKALAAGDSNIALVKVGARNSLQANLPAVGSQAVVHVK